MIWLYIIIIISSFIITGIYRKIAIKKSILDIPNIRSSHSVPTPIGGGVAIVITWYASLTYLFLIHKVPIHLFYALLFGFPLVIVSMIDDIKKVSPKIRLIIQFFSAMGGLFFIGGFKSLDLGFIQWHQSVLFSVLAVFGIMWFINLYNFLDGIDTYASAEAVFILLALFYFTHDPVLLVMVCAVLGFLYWNWPKAKIFMGDVGSTLLGYTLVILGIYYNNTGAFNFINWMILSSLFWFDATLTLYRRWRNREKLSVAHKKHAYQRIVQAGFSHRKTVLYATGINLFFFLLIILFQQLNIPGFVLFIIVLVIDYGIIKIVDKKKSFV